MFWHETTMRKPFFSEAKNVQKKNTNTFRKIINKAYFDEYLYRYVLKVDETYLQISFKTIFFKML